MKQHTNATEHNTSRKNGVFRVVKNKLHRLFFLTGKKTRVPLNSCKYKQEILSSSRLAVHICPFTLNFALSHLPVHICPFTFAHSHLSVHICQFTFESSHLRVHICPFTFAHSHLSVHICPFTFESSHLRVYICQFTFESSHLPVHICHFTSHLSVFILIFFSQWQSVARNAWLCLASIFSVMASYAT